MPTVETRPRILFVDDEPEVCRGVVRAFRDRYTVVTAVSAQQALEPIRDGQVFAVVVTDLCMPGTDGLTLITEARRLCPDSVFMLITGFAETEVAVRAVNEGRVYRFLTKPCPPDVLGQAIDEAVRKHQKIRRLRTFTYTAHVDQGRIVRIDRKQGCLAVTGYPAARFLAEPKLWSGIVLPEDRFAVRRRIVKILAGAPQGPIEFRIRRADGHVRWVRKTLIRHTDEGGRLSRLDALVEDITEAKRIEQALRASEERYHRMVANVPGLVFQFVLETDGTTRFVFVSERCREMFGLDPELVCEDAATLFDRFEPQDRAEILRTMAVSAEQLSPWKWWATGRFHGEDRLIQCLARPARTAEGHTQWDGLILDMTEQRRREEQIQQLARFPDENPNPVLRVDGEGRIQYANKAGAPLLRLWECELGQMLPANLLAITQEIKGSGAHRCVEVQCKDRIFSIVFASIRGADYVNLYARDVTEARQAHQELLRANAALREHDRLKSEFVTTVSHELRTPLCIFKNTISNAMAGVMGKLSPKLRASLEMADKSIDRLSRIIGDFLDISKIESGTLQLEREPLSVRSVVEEVVASLRPLAQAKSIEITTALPRTALEVFADRDRVIQVLTNLVGNAIKFIPVNGRIEVGAEDREAFVEWWVQDDGPGLSRDEQQRIFDRFVQIHKIAGAGEHGTGLGLTIAKSLVEMHGGRIWVDSAPARGCCFRFTLPKQVASDDEPGDTAHVLPESLADPLRA